MPRKYVRISNRGGWNTEAMQNAISAVKEKKRSVKQNKKKKPEIKQQSYQSNYNVKKGK